MINVTKFPTEQKAAHTATVESLTAEVRVLMVGNRQITLSVAKQLDLVDDRKLEVFGRVRLNSDSVSLIGKCKATGVLVMAKMPFTWPTPYIRGLSAPVTLCETRRRIMLKGSKLIFAGRDIDIADDSIQYCGMDGHGVSRYVSFILEELSCEHWSTNGMDEEISAGVAAYDARQLQIEGLQKLPLIVLAGLR